MTTPTVAPPRTALARMVGRVVTVECTWSAVAKRHEQRDWLYHCTDVVVYPAATLDHVWLLGFPDTARRKLYEGTRFTFRGTVEQYVRLDGSADYGIKHIGGLSVVRG